MLLLEKPIKEPLLLPEVTTKKEVRVEVTDKDIEEAYQTVGLERVHNCPIAQALKRMGYDYWVGVSSVNSQVGLVSLLPSKAQRFVRDFDNGVQVVPTSFYLNL